MTNQINPSQRPYQSPIINNQPADPQNIEPNHNLYIAKFREFNDEYQKSVKTHSKTSTKQKNINWLYNEKYSAEQQLQKIKEIKKLLKNKNIEIENRENFKDTLKKANAFYKDLIKSIQKEIKISPPLLTLKEHVKPQPVGPIDRIVQSIGECVNNIMRVLKHGWIFKKMDDLSGEYQKASPRNIVFFKKVLNAPGFKTALGLQKSTPTNHFNHLLNELAELRDCQLKSILRGRNALNLHDKLPSGRSIQDILRKAEHFIIALKMFKSKLNENSHGQMNEIINHMSVLIENALPRNTQVISDCLYPQCVLRSKSFQSQNSTIGRSLAGRIEASKEEGHLKGFSNRDSSNLLQRTGWRGVQVKKDSEGNDIFVKGFYNISLQTPDGHEASSGAELDLSPLGSLTEEQVKQIFDLATTLLSGRFELLGRRALSKDNDDKRRILLTKVERQIKDLHLSDAKVKKLREIVSDFSYKITSATTLTLLTVGHKLG